MGWHHRNRPSASARWRNPFCPNPAQFGDSQINFQQQFGRWSSKSHDHLWIDNENLIHKIWTATLDFFCKRRSILWRTTLENICDIAILPTKSHCTNHFIQFLPCSAHKWAPNTILGFPWCFANEKDICVGAALSKDRLNMPTNICAMFALQFVPLAEFSKPLSLLSERSNFC